MLSQIKILLSLTLWIALTSCGFTPMYSQSETNDGLVNALQTVEISNIANREGQYLRNRLIDRFYVRGTSQTFDYILLVQELTIQEVELDITRTADSTRAQLRINALMRLNDKQTNTTVLLRELRAVTSYNILASEFATRVAEQNAEQNALNDLSQQIETQLALFFQNQ